MTERERIVREAVRDLAAIGLKIDSLATDPETFMQIMNESFLFHVSLVTQTTYDGPVPEMPVHTFCGIPIKQVV